MFVIKYDKMSMIKFIQCIEKYPPIYNTHKHFSKEDVDKAWDKIALDVGEKDSLCRERWNSIKSCYIRHLKYAALNSRRRPYYLAEFLEFLKPFVSERIRSAVFEQYELNSLPSYLKEALPPTETASSFLAQSIYGKSNSEIKTEIVEIEKVEGSEWPGFTYENQQPSSSKAVPKRSLNTNCNYKKIKVKELRNVSPTSNNEDVTFFKSLLPDISRMSSHQKLKFKQETLSIVEDILYASDEINVCS